MIALAALAFASGCAGSAAPRAAQSSDAYANFLVGRLADLREDHQAASDRFFYALETSPSDPTLLEGAMTSSLALGDIDRARAVARLAAQHDVSIPYAHLLRTADALVAGRWRAADAEADRVEGASVEELTQRILQAWVDVGAGDADAAVAELARISAPRPYNVLLAYQRALSLDAAGRDAAAVAVYQEGIASGFWVAPAVERYADLLARTGARDQAVRTLREREGRFGSPAVLAAAARIESGGAASARPLNAARGAAITLYGLSLIFLEESDSTHGLATLTLALALDPELDAARIAYAEAQLDLDHPEEARTALEQVPANSPYMENVRVMQAWAALRDDRREEALRLARANVEAGGGPRAQRALADLYRAMEDHAAADPIYTQLIESAPEAPDWRLYYARGIAREQLGRWPEAEADLRRALELSPDQAEVLNYLGYTWIDRGENLQEGLAMIERAVTIRPLSGAIIDSLGWAHYKLGDYETALGHLERAVSLTPADSVLNDHLGDAYWRLDRRTEARFQWRRALSLDPTADDRAALEQKLEQGLPPVPGAASATR